MVKLEVLQDRSGGSGSVCHFNSGFWMCVKQCEISGTVIDQLIASPLYAQVCVNKVSSQAWLNFQSHGVK